MGGWPPLSDSVCGISITRIGKAVEVLRLAGWGGDLTMKLLVACVGAEWADAALTDLRRAGLPKEVEAQIVCVATSPG